MSNKETEVATSRVHRILARTQAPVTVRTIQQRLNGALRSPEIRAALQNLEHRGLAHHDTTTTEPRGRQRHTWVLTDQGRAAPLPAPAPPRRPTPPPGVPVPPPRLLALMIETYDPGLRCLTDDEFDAVVRERRHTIPARTPGNTTGSQDPEDPWGPPRGPVGPQEPRVHTQVAPRAPVGPVGLSDPGDDVPVGMARIASGELRRLDEYGKIIFRPTDPWEPFRRFPVPPQAS